MLPLPLGLGRQDEDDHHRAHHHGHQHDHHFYHCCYLNNLHVMPALHGWHGEDRSDRWDENGDILDEEDGNDDQHDLEIAS